MDSLYFIHCLQSQELIFNVRFSDFWTAWARITCKYDLTDLSDCDLYD